MALSLSVPQFPHLGNRSLSQSDRENKMTTVREGLGGSRDVCFPSLVEFKDRNVGLRRPTEGSLSWKRGSSHRGESARRSPVLICSQS